MRERLQPDAQSSSPVSLPLDIAHELRALMALMTTIMKHRRDVMWADLAAGLACFPAVIDLQVGCCQVEVA